jgi:hypothetical protein
MIEIVSAIDVAAASRAVRDLFSGNYVSGIVFAVFAGGFALVKYLER